ncbi:hypothetical protein APHAL10511_004126 [Amanita phalloides]|nr:hypothetical protein APHAL10511_004126 [Amanita phalloides]
MSFQSFSVPSSPVMTRSSRPQPITPQRLPRHHQQHRLPQSAYKSPTTPSSSYSPLSLRSATSAGSSVLNTPDNSGVYSKRLLLNSCSPLVAKSRLGCAGDRSLADIAENWRSRADDRAINASSENSCTDDGDDEASERTLSDSPNGPNMVPTGEALLPPPFLSNQRRNLVRPRSQTHAAMAHARTPSSPTMTRTNRAPLSSLVASRRTSQSENLLATPPPNRILSSQFKLKGSFTDPAQPRRREAFGVVRTPSQNVNVGNASFTYGLNPGSPLDLFDIDEGDFENDYDSSGFMRQDGDTEESFSLDADSLYGYPSYPIKFSQSQFADPFHGANVAYGMTRGQARPLGTITENVEYSFPSIPQDNFHGETGEDMFIQGPERNYYPFAPQFAQNAYYTEPPFVPYPTIPFSVSPLLPSQVPQQQLQPQRVVNPAIPSGRTPPRQETPPMPDVASPTDCSVCLVKRPRSLAILVPCRHPLCSACLTSALNIVGEKDMECAVCKKGVNDFRLVALESTSSGAENALTGSDAGNSSKALPSGSCGTSKNGNLNAKVNGSSLFADFGLGSDGSGEQGDPFIRASTPKEEQSKAKVGEQSPTVSAQSRFTEQPGNMENVVLRIDNVPWDITPPQIRNWLQQPVKRVHVLLDAKGKTLSHAYVEVEDSNIAGAILRGEAHVSSASRARFIKKERSSVLGRGRRARGVTVTKSGQEELMADLFPHWRGTFDGSRPSLAGLDSDHVIDALERGLMTENELKGLLYLIREPDSHFLKVPSLPFHLLISILSKFPADVDSRVFWSANLRDLLYDVAHAAAQILQSRVRDQVSSSAAYSIELVAELIQAAIDSRALTSEQRSELRAFARQESIPLAYSEELSEEHDQSAIIDSEPVSHCEPLTPGSADVSVQLNEVTAKDVPFDELAREFGVEAHLVQALAQRLAGLNP